MAPHMPAQHDTLSSTAGACDVHRAMSWFSSPPRRCWVCHPEDWHEPEGAVEHAPSLVPDSTTKYQPAVPQCHVYRNPADDVMCRRPWDREHTVLGFAVCAECWEGIRES